MGLHGRGSVRPLGAGLDVRYARAG
jgi:hypothetical protein